MKYGKQRIVAFLAAICLTAGSLFYPGTAEMLRMHSASAKTIAEIDAEKKQKQNEIEAKQAELKALQNDLADQAQYQLVLQEQIDLINAKLLLIDSQLFTLNTDIESKQQEIAQLEIDIEKQEKDIDKGLEEFKQRIRTLYVHGNDSILSALVGATDFYDVLAKIDLINRVAKHDDEMVKKLQKDLQTLSDNKTDLTARVQALNLKITETESVQKEFNESRSELNSAVEKTTAYMLELEEEKKLAASLISSNEQDIQKLDEERDRIILEEARKAEVARKAREEAERKRREEEERKKQTTVVTTAPNGKNPPKTTTTTTEPPVTVQPPPYNGGKLAWPAPGFYYISSPFGWRWGRNHNGIDIAGGGIQGASATAAASGTVTKIYTGCSHNYKGFCGCNYGWGNYVMVSHGNGLVTLYAHLQAVSVSVGDTVSTGTTVGKIGCTGNSTGFHLHFGVISNGSYVNPINYLN